MIYIDHYNDLGMVSWPRPLLLGEDNQIESILFSPQKSGLFIKKIMQKGEPILIRVEDLTGILEDFNDTPSVINASKIYSPEVVNDLKSEVDKTRSK